MFNHRGSVGTQRPTTKSPPALPVPKAAGLFVVFAITSPQLSSNGLSTRLSGDSGVIGFAAAYARNVEKIEMRATLPDVDLNALEAWVNDHGEEFATVTIYKVGLTMYRIGVPPTTVVHHPGRIADALAEALATIGGGHGD